MNAIDSLVNLKEGIIRTTPRKTIKICFDVIEQCNLNCAGCLVYSPCVKNNGYVMDVRQFEDDICRLSELFSEDEITVISLSGGEPLLHHDIQLFPAIIRKYFQNVNIRIVSNGLLLEKMSNDFYRCLRDNKVTVEQTKYPIDLDFIRIKEKLYEENVRYVFFDNTGESEKTMQIFPVAGDDEMSELALLNSNERLHFFDCWEANQCIRVQDGKCYTCSRIPHIHLLNEMFGTNYKVMKDDYIDIYKAEKKQDIYEFLASAVPFCRYCQVEKITDGHKWKVSERKREEWII